jgi:hypothetical protein
MNLDLTPLGQAGKWLAGAKLLSPFFEKALGALGSEVGALVSDPIAEWRKRLAERRAQRLVRIGSSAAFPSAQSGSISQEQIFVRLR